jgi:hypothetical protein
MVLDESSAGPAGREALGLIAPSRRGWIPRRRVVLGITEHATPSFVFVAAGVLLGPEFLNLLSEGALGQLDPVISVALAVLGIFVGAGFATARRKVNPVWIAAAFLEASATLLCVAGGMTLLFSQWAPVLPLRVGMTALVLGTCAAASAALDVARDAPEPVTAASHLADFDDIPLVAVSAVAVPLLANTTQPGVSILLSVVVGVLVAAAGALLFERASNPAERLAFVTGTVILLGGSAAYAGGSPLATGFVAALFWTRGASATVSLVEFDLRRLQHPLVAILLVIAGASIQFSLLLLWIAAPLVLCRLTGKLLGSLITAQFLGVPAGLLATILVPPGVLGIALALNVQQVLGTADTVVVSAVTVAVIASEVLGFTLLPWERR